MPKYSADPYANSPDIREEAPQVTDNVVFVVDDDASVRYTAEPCHAKAKGSIGGGRGPVR